MFLLSFTGKVPFSEGFVVNSANVPHELLSVPLRFLWRNKPRIRIDRICIQDVFCTQTGECSGG